MPQITIDGKKYHLVERVIVSLELREMNAGHAIITTGQSICRAGDKFDRLLGRKLAFKELMSACVLAGKKEDREYAWDQFFNWARGVKKQAPVQPEQEHAPALKRMSFGEALYRLLTYDKNA